MPDDYLDRLEAMARSLICVVDDDGEYSDIRVSWEVEGIPSSKRYTIREAIDAASEASNG